MPEPSTSEPEASRGEPAGDPVTSLTDAQLDAALEAIVAPGRLEQAEALVARAAPSLQRVLANALQDGGWFDDAHEQAVRDAVGREDPHERVRAVQTLLAEETRLGMLVGVAVGYELARELHADGTQPASAIDPD